MIVYKTTNLINGKIYIGQDRNNNPSYLGSGKKLKRAITKYGRDNFVKETLETCTSEEELNDREVYWISTFNSQSRATGYNISAGGKEGDRSVGHKVFQKGLYQHWLKKYGKEEADKKWEEKRLRLSETIKRVGSPLTNKGRYQLWLEKFGKDEADARLENWKKNISRAQQVKKDNGWTHSEEARRKIGEANRNRGPMPEHVREKLRKPKPNDFGERISKALTGITRGPSPRRIPVIQYDLNNNLIKEWSSAHEAETSLKVFNIYLACKGKAQTVGGFIWKYKHDEQPT